MNHRPTIQKAIDHIEANLRSELSLADLASMAGYSPSHFAKLFLDATGLSFSQYILRRRLLHAIFEMQSHRPRIEVALCYGFDTYAGFYKAFRHEFSCTPTQYLQRSRAKRPGRWTLSKEEPLIMNHRKAVEMLKHWHLENETITDIYYENTGNRCENAYAVGTKYVLKFTANPEKIAKHIALSHALARQGMRTAEAVCTCDGDESVQMGDLYGYVTHRVHGRQLITAQLYADSGLSLAHRVGRFVGQIQLALRSADVLVPASYPTASLQHNAEEAAALLHLSPADRLAFCEKALPLLSSLPRQLVHRDLNPGSILLAEEGWGVIDLELAEQNVRIWDPCYAATAILSESFDRRNEWLDIYHQLFSGYNQVCPMTAQEREAVPYLIIANQLAFVAWFARQENLPDILSTNLDMTRWLMEHFDQLTLKGEPSI